MCGWSALPASLGSLFVQGRGLGLCAGGGSRAKRGGGTEMVAKPSGTTLHRNHWKLWLPEPLGDPEQDCLWPHTAALPAHLLALADVGPQLRPPPGLWESCLTSRPQPSAATWGVQVPLAGLPSLGWPPEAHAERHSEADRFALRSSERPREAVPRPLRDWHASCPAPRNGKGAGHGEHFLRSSALPPTDGRFLWRPPAAVHCRQDNFSWTLGTQFGFKGIRQPA